MTDRLTVHVSGPQGSGKTELANWLKLQLPIYVRAPYHRQSEALSPTIVEVGNHQAVQVVGNATADTNAA